MKTTVVGLDPGEECAGPGWGERWDEVGFVF